MFLSNSIEARGHNTPCLAGKFGPDVAVQADMINRAEQRPVVQPPFQTPGYENGQKRVNGSSGVKRSLDGFRRAQEDKLASSRMGKNPPYRMNRGAEETRVRPGAICPMLGRADTQEAMV